MVTKLAPIARCYPAILGGALSALAGCPAAPDGDLEMLDEAEDTDPIDPDVTDPDGATGGMPGQGEGESGADPEGSTDGGEETGDGCTFICDDTGGPAPACDPWAQDCPQGEKCMPWANDGGAAWNSLRCVPLTDAPRQAGDACMVEGSGVSGVDDCDTSLMCWNADETGQGVCVPFCSGSSDNPLCDDPNATCVIANDGVLNLCLPSCDPLVQDCSEGEACYGAGDSFACAPDASGPDEGAYGDGCEYTNACDPGLYCAAAEAVPDCAGSLGCCAEFCDLDAANPDAQCSGAAAGQLCEPWFSEGAAPPGLQTVGACVLPQ